MRRFSLRIGHCRRTNLAQCDPRYLLGIWMPFLYTLDDTVNGFKSWLAHAINGASWDVAQVDDASDVELHLVLL